jgi:hypothetical protein
LREFVNSRENTTPVRRLAVASWWYEPDYGDDYRELHELERELGDTGPYRYELLSVWRLARDPSFDLFLHTPGPDGRAAEIEHLRPNVQDLEAVPAQLIESTRRHYHGRERLWCTEGELVPEILTNEETFPYAYSYPERLWMEIKSNWDVFANLGAYDEWWRIGNLRTDSVAAIVARFEQNECAGLRTIYSMSPRKLAKRYGDSEGDRICTDSDDLLSLYVARHCQEITRLRSD